ncbi:MULTISPECIES: hypothetical protein [Actinomadura]|uniref:Uncharacterized protein n=1 Tax=Actinomadura madurae TaxID=1993 RepID=A0A1I5JNW1_9ACTN|nr:hypothetical protein [Actinomadura madurae]SFO74477.1 hypothetical protein SAMN04489713_10996 [Actinomadura madurae]SPT64187.1 Uncharacterised protein [Actinomadura madurae]
MRARGISYETGIVYEGAVGNARFGSEAFTAVAEHHGRQMPE